MQNKIDFRFLKNTLIFLSVAILLSITLVVAGQQFEELRFQEYTQVNASLNKTHSKYRKLVEDIDLLQQYKEAYRDYKKNGLIGEERRLTWIETLEAVNDVLKLPKLTYALAPQENFLRPGFTQESKIKVNSTPMTLTMDLLHEEDLFAVFEGIQDSIQNLFTIDSCQISRKERSGTLLNTRSANLSSTCLIRWVTVDVE